ncbi:MAG: FHA domain-containing protein [Chloroflexi bacterium]|nr:FHA domain-containing protein [Chloroflexota bacterium]
MESKQDPGAFELLSGFMKLRMNGLNRDDAWYKVIDAFPDLPKVTRKAFLKLAKDWERREGHKYRHPEADKDSTLSRKQINASETSANSNGKTKPSAGLTGTLDPARLQGHTQQRLEQILDQLDDEPDDAVSPAQHDAPSLPRQATQSQESSTPVTAEMRFPPDYFGPSTILLMYFKAYPDPLRITVEGEEELWIGRATPNSAMAPEIDLNFVNGGEFGVSRMHAAITRRNNQLLLADLESMNYTYVNGVRLLPKEIRVLRDGDEIWFGQLMCRIRFQHR